MNDRFEISDLNVASERVNNLEVLASFLRRDALEVILTANNGHIGGSLSSVELLTAMYFG